MLFDPVTPSTDSLGYRYVETSPDWKLLCRVLPSFAALQWPGYETRVVEDTIGGEAVLIQLWKGRCQRFFGLDEFPGGIGAEVGVYRRIPGKQPPGSFPTLPARIERLVLGLLPEVGTDLWWPFPELAAQIAFDFINPDTNVTFFSAGQETTYWLNRWMMPDSYRQYEAANRPLPPLAEDYLLSYRINGKSYPIW